MTYAVRSAAAAIAVAALLLVGGCSLIPSIPGFGGPGGSSSDDSGRDMIDEVEENPFLSNEVPEGFPSEVPLPDLDIVLSLRVGENSWAINYRSDDLERDYAAIVVLYQGAGWETLMNTGSGEGAFGAFSKGNYHVQITGVPDADTDFDGAGFSLTVLRTI